MKQSIVLSALGSAALALGHGLVSQFEIGGKLYNNFSPYFDQYQNPKPQRIGWTVPSNGPVEDVNSAGITCNIGSTTGALSAEAPAGSQVKFFWTEWAESHKGPTMTYLAKCPDADCTTANPNALGWFKIDHAGLNADGTWISDTIIANNNTWAVTIPSDIAPGPYLMRHELLALHAAHEPNGAQFYPQCTNLQITGSGSAVPDTVKFPGAYSPTDPGISINIHYPTVTNYTIPGPAPYVPGQGPVASPSSVIAVPTTSAAASSAIATSVEPILPSVEASSTAEASSTVEASSTLAGAPVFPTLSAPIVTGPATFPTIRPSIIPPYANTTVVLTRPHTLGAGPSQTLEPTSSFTFSPGEIFETPVAEAPVSTIAPEVTYTYTETATVEKTVILTFTASVTETVTVGPKPAECTPYGRHKRGTYFM